MAISSIPEIVEDIKRGKMVIIVDDEDRENEGDLIMAAQFVTPESINFMITHARGLVCLPMHDEMVDRLKLPLMTEKNEAQYGTNFTVSIEAREGITTGISAADRAKTVLTAVSPTAKPEDVVIPGHIFPLRAKRGGVLKRAGHTEAGVDLCTIAGLTPAAVICEITNDDGTMARLPQLTEFAKKHDIKIGTIKDLIEFRNRTESLVESLGKRKVETTWGEFEQHVYVDKITGETHLAYVKGGDWGDNVVDVRVHEPFSAMDFILPDPRQSWPLKDVFAHMAKTGSGVLVLLHRTEDSKELLARAMPNRQNQGKWDSKTFGVGAQILADLNVKKMRVLGNASHFNALEGFGLEVAGYLANEGN